MALRLYKCGLDAIQFAPGSHARVLCADMILRQADRGLIREYYEALPHCALGLACARGGQTYVTGGAVLGSSGGVLRVNGFE